MIHLGKMVIGGIQADNSFNNLILQVRIKLKLRSGIVCKDFHTAVTSKVENRLIEFLLLSGKGNIRARSFDFFFAIGIHCKSKHLRRSHKITDRIIVMSEGRIAGEVDTAHATQERIMELCSRFADKKEGAE